MPGYIILIIVVCCLSTLIECPAAPGAWELKFLTRAA